MPDINRSQPTSKGELHGGAEVNGLGGLNDFPTGFRWQDLRERLGLGQSDGGQDGPIAWEGDSVEKLDGRYDRPDRSERKSFSPIDQISSNLLFAESVGRAGIVLGKLGNGRAIGFDSVGLLAIENKILGKSFG